VNSYPPSLPDLLSLIPEGNAKLIVLHCFDALNLSVEDAEMEIGAALKLVSALDWLLRGGPNVF
jgi:hypothetical protein